jgi:AcrR family transcriptional regulator
MPAASNGRRSTAAKAPKRLAKDRNKSEERVFRAASEIFWRKGFTATTMQDIADKLGVLKGSLYYYIDTKEDLLWWIVEDVHAEWSTILEESHALEAEPIERIRVFIVRHITWYLTNLKQVSVFFHDWRDLTGARYRQVRERRRAYEQVIRDLFAQAQAAGDISPDLDLAYAARYVLAAVNAVPNWYRPSGSDSIENIAEAYADMTVGLLTGTPNPAWTTPRT